MAHNLRLYHKVLSELRNWVPDERVQRTRNLALLVTGLVLSMGIHLSEIVSEWHLPSKQLSLVNRLRRLLANEQLDERRWYRPLAQQLINRLAHTEIRLIIDATPVGFGHRLLTVSLAYRQRALPLSWSVHEGRQGTLPATAALALLRAVARLLPRGATVWLLGDAGFQHVPLLRWVRQQGWSFVIRQQGRLHVRTPAGAWRKIRDLAVQPGETVTVGWVRLTEEHDWGWVWLVLHWADGEDEPWYLVSNVADSRLIVRRYALRMWTEELYGDLKGHGFHLEATHLRHAERISRLVLGICISYVWFLTLGSWVVKRGLRHFIDRKDRRDKSYFRLGLDWIRRCLRLNQPIPLRFSPYP